MLVVTYDQDDLVELVEVGYGVDDQVFFYGVQPGARSATSSSSLGSSSMAGSKSVAWSACTGYIARHISNTGTRWGGT